MMAGHPGETSPLNLRNLGFTIWVGENDDEYDRNTLARTFAERLDALRAADPEGYLHSLNVVRGAGHWMNSADTMAVPWMARLRRNPLPDRIVWRQEESAQRRNFYWLGIPASAARAGAQATVQQRGNTFTIERCDYPTLYIDLNDKMTDLDGPVRVMREGVEIFNGIVHRREWRIRESVRERADPDYIFSARLEISGTRVRVL
jgi:hypothetical protein